MNQNNFYVVYTTTPEGIKKEYVVYLKGLITLMPQLSKIEVSNQFGQITIRISDLNLLNCIGSFSIQCELSEENERINQLTQHVRLALESAATSDFISEEYRLSTSEPEKPCIPKNKRVDRNPAV